MLSFIHWPVELVARLLSVGPHEGNAGDKGRAVAPLLKLAALVGNITMFCASE